MNPIPNKSDEIVEAQTKYERLLQNLDWSYEYSEDYRAWLSGRMAMQAVQALQQRLDPAGVIWNQYAPDEWHIEPNRPPILPMDAGPAKTGLSLDEVKQHVAETMTKLGIFPGGPL